MNMKRSVLGGALSLLCVASVSLAADPVNLEGTWKVSSPPATSMGQAAFKPEGGSIPFTAYGRKRYQDNKKLQAAGKSADFDYAAARCSSPGATRLMLTPQRFRIWQRNGFVGMQFEWNRLYRQVDMGGLIKQARQGPLVFPGAAATGPSDDELVGRAIPVSKGKWEGDTLVITTEGFADNTLLDNLVPHGYDLKTTERLRLKDSNTLENRITIEDPEYFTKPWETVVTYTRQADEAFPESVCLDTLPNFRH
jgi:hypothetical protein